MISVPYTEYLKFRKNWILYTRILTKKYHIPELKWPGIPYTQNPWPGLSCSPRENTFCLVVARAGFKNVFLLWRHYLYVTFSVVVIWVNAWNVGFVKEEENNLILSRRIIFKTISLTLLAGFACSHDGNIS